MRFVRGNTDRYVVTGERPPPFPEDVARDIMRHVIGDYVPQDDIALVVMRRIGSPVETKHSAP